MFEHVLFLLQESSTTLFQNLVSLHVQRVTSEVRYLHCTRCQKHCICDIKMQCLWCGLCLVCAKQNCDPQAHLTCLHQLQYHYLVITAGCGEPIPPGNGSIYNFQSAAEGATITYNCSPGLVPRSQMSAVCTNMAWRPDPATLECREPGEYCMCVYRVISNNYDTLSTLQLYIVQTDVLCQSFMTVLQSSILQLIVEPHPLQSVDLCSLTPTQQKAQWWCSSVTQGLSLRERWQQCVGVMVNGHPTLEVSPAAPDPHRLSRRRQHPLRLLLLPVRTTHCASSHM